VAAAGFHRARGAAAPLLHCTGQTSTNRQPVARSTDTHSGGKLTCTDCLLAHIALLEQTVSVSQQSVLVHE